MSSNVMLKHDSSICPEQCSSMMRPSNARTYVRTYGELLTLISCLPLRLARRGAARFDSDPGEELRPVWPFEAGAPE